MHKKTNTHQGTTVCKVYIALGWTFTSCYKNQSLNLAMLTKHDEDIVMEGCICILLMKEEQLRETK